MTVVVVALANELAAALALPDGIADWGSDSQRHHWASKEIICPVGAETGEGAARIGGLSQDSA